ncbi:ComF family protein [Paenibacillus cremeus]|uniref:ComF family protein n=1 Tax=Paenibacillus cremeus TaxID=2163881 RepID=A0A559KB52_9BACL|nr:ComF family protein [Paenibacillus cremeus]TVY09329.1 ComF family protein [Paenibacillus cremeus]
MIRLSIRRCLDWIGLLESFLAPRKMGCISCGSRYDRTRPIPVCQPCWEAIPWILKVACRCCGRYESCTDCRRREVTHYYQNRSAVQYDERMKAWLALYKYRGQEKLRQVMGPMLLHAFHLHRRFPQEALEWTPASEFISYVPLSQERLAERGFNQAKQLAEELGRLVELLVISILQRTRRTDKQSFKARAARLDDLQGVFAVDPDGLAAVTSLSTGGTIRIYMIDDVYTTGSTLNECARTLKNHLQAEVYGISWAR